MRAPSWLQTGVSCDTPYIQVGRRFGQLTHDSPPDGLGIRDGLELEAVLKTGDAVVIAGRSDSDDELIICEARCQP